MNILNLATTDENAAGVPCLVVNEMFRKAGHNSVILVSESASGNPGVIALKNRKYGSYINTFPGKLENKLRTWYRKLSPLERDDKYSFHNLDEGKKYVSGSEILERVPFKPDVILVFWVSQFVNTATMAELSALTGARIFWLMTDNAPLTGGCHYPWDCKGFQSDCSGCPAILTPSQKGIAEKNLALKKKNLPESLELISGSVSDYNRALSAALFRGKRIHKLVAPVDEEKFKPGSKADARQIFGLGQDKKVIFYGANSFTDPRKGSAELLYALRKVCDKLDSGQDKAPALTDVVILLAGRDGQDFFKEIPIEVKSVGYLKEADLIRAYQAADFMVSPSLEDSGPMMINQSVMCGTPMVTFDTGVAMDIVRNGETGYRAKLGDISDLATGIFSMLCLNKEALGRMSAQCRQFALQELTPGVYAARLMNLFK